MAGLLIYGRGPLIKYLLPVVIQGGLLTADADNSAIVPGIEAERPGELGTLSEDRYVICRIAARLGLGLKNMCDITYDGDVQSLRRT